MLDVTFGEHLISAELSGTLLVDEDGIIVYVSDFVCKLLEYNSSDILNQHVVKVLNPDIYEKAVSLVETVFKNPGLYQSFWKIYKRNGEYITCLLSGALTEIQQKRYILISVIPTKRDSTLKSYSVLLTPLVPVEHYRELYDESDSMVGVANHEGMLVYVNQAITEQTNYPSSKIIGKTIFEIIHSDDLGKVSRVFSENVNKPSTIIQFTCRILYPNKQYFWWNLTFHNLLYNPDIKGIVIYARKLSSELGESLSQDFCKEIIDGLSYPVILVNLLENEIIEYNIPAEIKFKLSKNKKTIKFNEFSKHIGWNILNEESLFREVIKKNEKEPYYQYFTSEINSTATHYQVSYHRFHHGSIDLLAIYFQDVTLETIFRNTLTLEHIKYEYLFNNISTACVFFDDKLSILEANAFFLKQYDYGIEQITGKHVDLLYQKDNIEKILLLMNQARENPYALFYDKFEKLARNQTSFQSIDTVIFMPTHQKDIFLMLSEPISLASITHSRFQETYHELLSLYEALPDMYFKLNVDGSCLEYRIPSDYQKFVKTDSVEGDLLHQILPYSNIDEVQASINQCIITGQPTRIIFDINYSKKEYFEARFVPFHEGQVVAIVRLVTRTVEDENRIKQSLIEKEVLIREIHHRVKNNLQIISSLLSLQSASIADTSIQEKIIESQSRIRLMAMIHEKLYQSADLSLVSLRDFVESLGHFCVRTYSKKRPIQLRIDVVACALPVDTCISVGLFLHETICNAIKHAFSPETVTANIFVELKEKKSFYILSVTDNGIGMPAEHTSSKVNSLGMQLIWTTARQLSGTLNFSIDDGTSITLAFPAPNVNPSN